MTKNYFHICNPNTPEKSGVKNIYSIAELQEIKEDAHTVYLIHIHLNWNGNKLNNNYGFDIANLIRTEQKSKAPIIFYSPIQVEYFEQKSEKEIKYKTLFGRGSAFLEAPFKEAALNKLAESIEPLSDAALHDVVTMLCNLKGIVIDKLNHDLKSGADIDKVIGSVTPYLSALQKQLIGLDKFVSDIKAAKNSDGFDTIKRQFILLCNDRLTEKGKDNSQEINAKPHTILLLDDLQEEINKAKENLKEQFNIVEATTGRQAIDILKKDVANNIVAVIADWRLFTDAKQTYWQPLQGYEVLDFSAKNGIRSLFALTSQADFIVHHLRNLMGIRFSMFKKENLNTPDQWKVFTDVLFEACEEAELVRSNIPDSDNWEKTDRAIDKDEEKRIKKNTPERHIFTKQSKGSEVTCVSYTSLHEQYLAYCHSQDRETLFSKVDEKADEVWEYLTALYQNDKNYKGVEILRNRFDIETPKDSLLFPVLVLRRIWMALWYKHVDDSVKLSQSIITQHSKFIFGVVHKEGFSNFTGNSQDAEQTKLCISISQVRNKKMLPEERAWLIKWGLLDTDKQR
jgi:hypothetical protein